MKRLMTLILSVVFAVGMVRMAIAGSLDSLGSPSAGSGMYTLQNLYDYLTSGTALTVQTSFQEPTSSPGSTMKTTREIGDDIKALFDLCPVSSADVKSGVRFFCTQAGGWGVQTGTAQLVPTATPSPTITPTPTVTPTIWDSAACSAKGGYWAPLGSGLSGNGCWFYSAASDSCDDTCSAKTLSCDPRGWTDNTSCTICDALRSDGHNECLEQPMNWGPAYGRNNACIYGSSTSPAQECSRHTTPEEPQYHRLCVCR
ncbi:MAG: hypothetical protein NTZ78_01345 [Candidatus Aureabacteria bacterium]|nr:hypothetical protein [Candidatus Auribacterota bacterium]